MICVYVVKAFSFRSVDAGAEVDLWWPCMDVRMKYTTKYSVYIHTLYAMYIYDQTRVHSLPDVSGDITRRMCRSEIAKPKPYWTIRYYFVGLFKTGSLANRQYAWITRLCSLIRDKHISRPSQWSISCNYVPAFMLHITSVTTGHT